MPPHNRFRHQVYHANPPSAPYRVLGVGDAAIQGPMESREWLAEAGRRFQAAGIARILLVHGTFVGEDALGIVRALSAFWPKAALRLRQWQRETVAALTADAGNFTESYARELEAGLATGLHARIPVERFHWSSENHHIGRADGAVRLLDRLLANAVPAGQHCLLWCHSHGGNVAALLTNLLGADRRLRHRFFRLCEAYYRAPFTRRDIDPTWQRVREALCGREPCAPLQSLRLDIVTMGTPIRYGWDTGGYERLLHIINHRPAEGLPIYLAAFPQRMDDVLQAVSGDYVQQLGIAGTNIRPLVTSFPVWWANQRLQGLLQRGIRHRDLWQRLRLGMRVPAEGLTCLVDYGDKGAPFAEQLAGHAVYTRRAWLAFHARLVAQCLY